MIATDPCFTRPPGIYIPEWAEPLFEPHRYKVPYGGRGSSKSWTVADVLIMIAYQPSLLFPDRDSVRILCARELQNSIEESVHQVLAEQIHLMGLSPFFDIQQRSIRCTLNGSEFIFSGIAKNVTKIKSMENIDICWVEEAEKISANSWKVLIPTIRKSGSEIWLTFNPDQEEDPTWQKFVVHPPPDIWSRLVNWRDNPFFPEVLRKEMEYDFRVDAETAMHVWEGALNTRSDAIIFRGKYRSEVLQPVTGSAFDEDNWHGPYYGADWGFSSDPNTLTKCWITPKSHPERILYVEKEWWDLGTDLDDIHKGWLEAIPEVAKANVVRADCARPETIHHVTKHGHVNVEGTEKWPECVEDGITWLRSFDAIVFHPRCEHGLIEARTYKYKVDQLTGRVLRDIVDKNNHIWDSIRYAFDEVIKQTQSIYNCL